MKPIIYLAGPITGLSYGEAVDWRVEAREKLESFGYKVLSPMRGKDFLKNETDLSATFEQYNHILTHQKSVMTRDYNDCRRCDLLFVNFLGAKDRSLGTAMEIAWCFQRRVPVIGIMEKSGNPNEHGMILEGLNYRLDNLESGYYMAKQVLD